MMAASRTASASDARSRTSSGMSPIAARVGVQVPKPQSMAHPEAGCHSDSDSDSDRAGRCQGASSTEAENAARSVTATSAPPPHACRYDAMYIPGYRYVPLRGAALRR